MSQHTKTSRRRLKPSKTAIHPLPSPMKNTTKAKRKNGKCLDTHQAAPIIPPQDNSKSLECPICGGWIIVEHSMEFYHRGFLKKCLNCGRILNNPFLSRDAPASLTARCQPPPFPQPVKLDCTFLLRLQHHQKNER